MPLVRIDALRADAARLDALGRAVHAALVETVGFAPDDVFQILTSHHGTGSTMRYDNYLGVRRDDDVVFVSITMRAGRSPEVKRSMYRRIAELVQEQAATEPRNVVVTVTENESADWSFGNGVAQYLESA